MCPWVTSLTLGTWQPWAVTFQKARVTGQRSLQQCSHNGLGTLCVCPEMCDSAAVLFFDFDAPCAMEQTPNVVLMKTEGFWFF